MLTTIILLYFAQVKNENPVRLRNDQVPVDRSIYDFVEKKSGLSVASVVPEMNAEEIWQSAPYCGANSLYVLLRLSDVKVEYPDIKKEVPTALKGASLLNLQEAARRYGLETEVVRTEPDDLRRLGVPLIALLGAGLNQEVVGHYVVVCSESDNEIAAVDGTTGNLDHLSKAVFNRAFSGYVLARKRGVVVEARGYGRMDIALLIGCVLNLIAIAAVLFIQPSDRRVHWRAK